MQRQASDPLVFPVPSFFAAARIIFNHTAAGGEFTSRDLMKISGLTDSRMLFEAAWLAADQIQGLAWFNSRRLANTWWREWVLCVQPPRLH
ncbi:hypothetical protein BI364_10375 [Acidihalobacter yilgarnensis]|uniref:Uncharacterized protein n=1 Tax=Acidihalobacter yilgarnensis TaxID=2819280 RepID=A0A1D8IPC3_9GAMM|nr:hypothetical protein [Acidihalobacter yilgarnensis]AOU98312.1 hypothetical protein BI364_10375 [Acidihalobacter yilgarnensis]